MNHSLSVGGTITSAICQQGGNNESAQSFSTLALLKNWAREFFFVVRDCLIHSRMLNSIPGLYSVDASSMPLPQNCNYPPPDNSDIPWEEKHHSQLQVAGLAEAQSITQMPRGSSVYGGYTHCPVPSDPTWCLPPSVNQNHTLHSCIRNKFFLSCG